MINRKNRFHGLGSVAKVYKRGQRTRQGQLAAVFIKNPNRKDYRLAVVVSKKVHKSAVTRNKIRRRVFEAVRTNLPKNFPPIDIVITVFDEEVAIMPANELKETTKELLNKIILKSR